MKVQLDFDSRTCTVQREEGDPKFYTESRFFYHLKKHLIRHLGIDLIKKRMWKDGHLVDETQQYIRTRKPSGNPYTDIYVWDHRWMVRRSELKFNEGEVTLSVEYNVFGEHEL